MSNFFNWGETGSGRVSFYEEVVDFKEDAEDEKDGQEVKQRIHFLGKFFL